MRNSMPLPATQQDCMSAAAKRYKYLRRMFKFNQMDFEFACWQMLYLLVAPQKVYRNFHYRKQTKSQFARDDPAFLVLFAFWLCITSIGSAIALRLTFGQFIRLLLYVVFVDCIGVGILVASIFWYCLNKYFRDKTEVQDVEWGYAFDVHINAFFPPLIFLHFPLLILYLYTDFIKYEWFISALLGNTIWLVAVLYYAYITFLGYSSLNFLQHTHLILTPLPLILFLYLLSLATGFNITPVMMAFYKNRAGAGR